MIILHPLTGVESHIKIRKASACKHCWEVPGRHQNSCPLKGYCMMCLEKLVDLPNEGRRHACGQGYMSKPQERRRVDPGDVPDEAPIPSTLAATLRANQLANIQAAKAKRKRETEEPSQDQAPEPTPAQAAAPVTPATAANKASRSGNDSPGGSSPQPTNNTAPAPEQATAPSTVIAGRKGNRKNK
jgi:hypothetical protein